MVPRDLNIINIGFQGLALIQRQIYNPINPFSRLDLTALVFPLHSSQFGYFFFGQALGTSPPHHRSDLPT